MGILRQCGVFSLLLGVACATDGAWLPSGFIGHWGGVPTYTSSGPRLASSGGINFTIHPINDHYWFMEDSVGRTIEMKNSQQQFWINGAPTAGNVSSDLGVMSYCGWLTGYYKTMPQHGLVMVTKITRKTNRSLTFTYTKELQPEARLYMPWTVETWMDLAEDGHSMELFVALPSGPEYTINHIRVNMTRLDRNPWKHLSDVGKSYVEANVDASTVCNFTAVPVPMPPVALEDVAQHDVRRFCPHGFTERDGPMPDFVRRRIEDRVAKEQVEAKTKIAEYVSANWRQMPFEDVQRLQEELYPVPSLDPHSTQQYQYCAMLSSFNNVTLQTTWDPATKSVHGMISARPVVRPASESWIAVGIMPAWPSMFGMDIMLGYFGSRGTSPKPCIRSMYALHNAGTPVDHPQQNITFGTVFTSDNDQVLHFQFTRPWSTGMWNLSTGPVFNSSYKFIPIPIVAWAIGEAPSSCEDAPNYHHEFRGTHGWSWLAPQTAVDPTLWCQGWSPIGRL